MAAPPAPAPRSTFVTVVAWVFIALAGFATFMSILQNIMIALVFPAAAMRIGMEQAAGRPGMPWFAAWMFQHMQLLFLFFLLASASCLAAAIGLLKRKNWARLLFIALMALGIAWNIGGVVAMVLFLPSLTEVLPPNRPELAHFGVMFKVMMAFNLVIVAAFVVLFGWVIKRLLSESVQREFVAAPKP